ncbi:SDR family oxidoreductase [Chloroflexota bacterium]
MTGQLENRVALVTGGSSGIGRTTALAFAKEGAKVVIGDILVAEGEETVNMIKKAGGKAIFVKADVSKAAEVEAMVKKAVDTYGRLDCAFNNAGIIVPLRPIPEVPEEDWDRLIDINLKGVWLCLKYEIPQMLKQGNGAIVNVASMLGLIGKEFRSPYASSKHGVVGLTKVAALENADKGIRVNAICPAPISTPILAPIFADPKAKASLMAMVPMERTGDPAEVAEAVVWLCSDASSFVTGVAMPIDGGATAK